MKEQRIVIPAKDADDQLYRLCCAITEALRESERCPEDSIQEIWNEALGQWQTGLRMDHRYCIERSFR